MVFNDRVSQWLMPIDIVDIKIFSLVEFIDKTQKWEFRKTSDQIYIYIYIILVESSNYTVTENENGNDTIT